MLASLPKRQRTQEAGQRDPQKVGEPNAVSPASEMEKEPAGMALSGHKTTGITAADAVQLIQVTP